MKILVTGGLGYIGSNTVVELINRGYEVIVVDNLYNSNLDVIQKIKMITNVEIEFYKIDVSKIEEVESIFKENKFEAIIHFAGYKSVGESVSDPLMYYRNNLISTITLSELCLKYNVNKFIFSSSATVYGSNNSPFIESMNLLPSINPYGQTKVICEQMLTDVSKANPNFAVTFLRYFNPVGGHKSGILNESPNGIPNNLMPYIVQVAEGKREYLSIFGNDYDTSDGTGVRDYIHVVDLALGHIAALENLKQGVNIFNLGTGKGTSVLQLVNEFSRVNNVEIPYIITKRRSGDIACCFADCSKAEREIGFKAKYSISEMCRDSLNKE